MMEPKEALNDSKLFGGGGGGTEPIEPMEAMEPRAPEKRCEDRFCVRPEKAYSFFGGSRHRPFV
jgi:hypothetical protein